MGTSLLLRVMCVVLCPALALTGYVAISSCECGCVDVAPFTVCCCDAAMSGLGTAAFTEGRDDCRVEMGDQKPPADAPPPFPLNPPVTAIAAANVDVPHSIWAVQSDRGAERRSLLAPISSQSPRAPPLA
jgi:hypothetical protein